MNNDTEKAEQKLRADATSRRARCGTRAARGNFWLHLREIKRQRDVIVANDLVK